MKMKFVNFAMMSEVTWIWMIALMVTCGNGEEIGQEFMVWMKSPKPQNAASVRVFDNQVFDWYAGGPPMVIGIFGRTNIKIRIHCKVQKLKKEYRLKKMVFVDGWKNTLYLLSNKNVKMHDWDGVSTYDPLTGGVVTFDIAQAKINYPKPDNRHIFSCAGSSNHSGNLLSSTVEILDFRKYFDSHNAEKKDVSPFDKNKPMSFKGYPKKFVMKALRSPSVFEWFYTSVPMDKINGETKGTSILDIESFEKWPVQVTSSGNLYWSFMTTKAVEELQGKRIYAKVEGYVMVVYSLPTSITSTGGNSVTTLNIIDPSSDGKELNFLTGLVGRARVPCTFEAGKGTFQISWKHGSTSLKSGYNSDKGLNVTRNYVEFVGPFKSESWKGMLECTVQWKPDGGESQTKTMKWSIDHTNVNLPRLAKELPQYAIVKDGGDVKIECEYENTYGIITSANIFGLETSNLDKKDYKLSNKLIKVEKMYNIKLDSSLSPKCCPMDPSKPVIYSSLKLTNNGKGNSSSHPFTCIAKLKKDLFIDTGATRDMIFRRQVIVWVLPKTSMEKTLSQWNCSPKEECDAYAKKNQIIMSYRVTDSMNLAQIRANFNWTLKANGMEERLPPDVIESGRFESKLNILKLMAKARKLFSLKDNATKLLGIVRCSTQLIDSWKNSELYAYSDSVTVNIPFKKPVGLETYIIPAVVVIIVLIVIAFLIWYLKIRPGGQMNNNSKTKRGSKGSVNDENEEKIMLEKNEARAIPL